MGYDRSMARRSVWQFLTVTKDPRIKMLDRFAKAMTVPLADLLAREELKQLKQPEVAVDKDAFYAAVRALVVMPPELKDVNTKTARRGSGALKK